MLPGQGGAGECLVQKHLLDTTLLGLAERGHLWVLPGSLSGISLGTTATGLATSSLWKFPVPLLPVSVSSGSPQRPQVLIVSLSCRISVEIPQGFIFFYFLFHSVLGQRAEGNLLLSHPSAPWSSVSKAHSPLLPLPCSRNFPDPHSLFLLMAPQRQLFESFDTYP